MYEWLNKLVHSWNTATQQKREQTLDICNNLYESLDNYAVRKKAILKG